ncbi:MAG TPA: restriction endonuclease subunit S [Candidatus Saccharibacteria bacterium]|nr:restriction endonuclease subunit S [Candidatus Saccharibacteria bacterium]
MKRLSDLVNIRSGYTFRTAIDSYDSGDTEVIQAKDLSSDFGFASRPKVDFPGDYNHLLRPGDILVSARGFSKAILFQDTSTKAVASSSLFVLHPKDISVNPEFITMFFNSVMGMKAVFELSSGASVKSITKDNFGQIVIPEIPPDKERALGSAVQSIDNYLSLMREKEIYLDSIRESIITKTLKETTL